MEQFKFQKVNLEVVSSFEEADRSDREYYLSLTSDERLGILEYLRELNYGNATQYRLQRVFEYTRAIQS